MSTITINSHRELVSVIKNNTELVVYYYASHSDHLMRPVIESLDTKVAEVSLDKNDSFNVENPPYTEVYQHQSLIFEQNGSVGVDKLEKILSK